MRGRDGLCIGLAVFALVASTAALAETFEVSGSCRDGLPNGNYEDARIESGRRLEAPFVADRLHGVLRSWYPSGLPRAEYRYERGQLVEARAWTDAGSPLSDADAASSATSDAEADQRMLDDLVVLVQEHVPRCD